MLLGWIEDCYYELVDDLVRVPEEIQVRLCQHLYSELIKHLASNLMLSQREILLHNVVHLRMRNSILFVESNFTLGPGEMKFYVDKGKTHYSIVRTWYMNGLTKAKRRLKLRDQSDDRSQRQ